MPEFLTKKSLITLTSGLPSLAEFAPDGEVLGADVAARRQGRHRGDDERQRQPHPKAVSGQGLHSSSKQRPKKSKRAWTN